MKILVLNWRDIEHPEAGGAEVHFSEIFGRLVKRGHEVTLLTTRFSGCRERAEYNGMEILRLGNNFFFNRQAPSLVKNLLREKRFDCIIDDVNKLPFASSRHFPEIPCGAIFHHLFGMSVFGATNPLAAAYVFISERSYARLYGNVECCAVSPSTAAELKKLGFDESKLTIIENGIDIERYSPDSSVKREEDLLLYVGRLKKYKRVCAILEAMSILDGSGKNTRLAVVGTGDDLPRLKKRAAELGLTDRVEFAGFVSEGKKIEYLRKAAIFVIASEKEGWGITNIEASACGTPVVANDAPGLRDSVADGHTGVLYRQNDVRALALSIEKLLDDRELRTRLGRQGSIRARDFTWDESAGKAEEWLLKITQKK